MTTNLPPQCANPIAEEALLTALLAAPAVADDVWTLITPDMFYDQRRTFLASLLQRMHADGADINPPSVVAKLAAAGKLSQYGNGEYVTTLFGSAYAPDRAPRYAEQIREAWVHRVAVVDTVRMAQKAQQPDAVHAELAVEFAELADKHAELAAPARPVGGQTILDVLDAHYGPHLALIPDLLWQRNRYVFTGGEGLGKSEFSAQIAACAVAGVHPFGGEDFKPLRVQVIDAENDGRQTQQRYRRLVPLVDKHATTSVDWSRLFMENRTGRWSLLNAQDLAWVRSVLDVSRPDILVIGSLYKLYRGASVNDEAAAGEVTAVFDDLRDRYDCALVIEGHMGKGKDASGRREGAVRGSSAFMGWPEFGHALQRAEHDPGERFVTLADVIRWRGDREPHADWPEQIRRGEHDELPWVTATELDVERFRYAKRASGF